MLANDDHTLKRFVRAGLILVTLYNALWENGLLCAYCVFMLHFLRDVRSHDVPIARRNWYMALTIIGTQMLPWLGRSTLDAPPEIFGFANVLRTSYIAYGIGMLSKVYL